MLTKMVFSEECLGVMEDNKPFQIFTGILFVPVALIFDIILLPLEIISLIIAKIIKGDEQC